MGLPVPSDTRSRVLRAAAMVFAERGYAGAGTAEIVLRTGMTRGAVYFHFASKSELAASVFEHEQSTWRECRARAVVDHDQGIAAIGRIFELVGAHLVDDVYAQAMLRLAHEADQVFEHTPSPIGELTDDVARRLRQAQLAGHLRRGLRPRLVAELLVASFLGVHEHPVAARTSPPDGESAEGRTSRRFRSTHSARLATWWDVVAAGLVAPGR